MNGPLVSVICLCHNQGRFVIESLESVTAQTYPNIQLIVVDDASNDDSKGKIKKFLSTRPQLQFVSHDSNVGHCAAFNSGYALARGEFVIDLAADDILLPGRIENGVREFQKRDDSFGVQYGDAFIIDELGKQLGMHSDRFPSKVAPEGDIYVDLVSRYFVCGTSMMMRRQVIDSLGGFDETLAYEDFDLWIRSAREFKYFYNAVPLVKRRVVKGGQHEKQFISGNRHAWSTLVVCGKILKLNRTRTEQSALRSRLNYEIRQSLFRGDLSLAWNYFRLWKENNVWKPLVD